MWRIRGELNKVNCPTIIMYKNEFIHKNDEK